MIFKAICVCLLAGAIGWCALATAVFIREETAVEPTKADCIIVLGARVMPTGELSTSLLRRVEKALSLYRRGLASYIIVCGARGDDEPETEAEAMRQWLLLHEVPEEAVFAESESVSTAENLRNARTIMEENGMSDAIVVTNAYHLTRAMWIARDEGLNAQGAAAANNDLLITRVKLRFREGLSWVLYALGI